MPVLCRFLTKNQTTRTNLPKKCMQVPAETPGCTENG
jgi:hypothetical protein